MSTSCTIIPTVSLPKGTHISYVKYGLTGSWLEAYIVYTMKRHGA